jgi:excisionase family DNA binding protein
MKYMKKSNAIQDNLLEKILLTPAEAARCLGVGRTTIFALVKDGTLESCRVRGARRIPVAALHAFVARAQVSDRRAG